MLRLSIRAAVEALEPARQQLALHLAPLELSERDVYRIELLLEEVVMNAVMHAFGDAAADHFIDLMVEVSTSDIRLTFEDDGLAFDPTAPPQRPAAQTLAEARPGGLGLSMLRRFSDDQAWKREDNRNCLTLTLRRT